MSYNRSLIVSQAHTLAKETGLSFGECQTRIWNKHRAVKIATKVAANIKLAYDSKMESTIETLQENRRIAYSLIESLKPLVIELTKKKDLTLQAGDYNKAQDIAAKTNALVSQINLKKSSQLNYKAIYVGVRCAMENELLIDKKLFA